MDSFDDLQIEEVENFDFYESEDLYLEDDDKTFTAFLNSNWDF
jgi:hypothetical protein